jgi:hypothetical protein
MSSAQTPTATPAYRLASMHRLRRIGLTFGQIGTQLGITPRHARRLSAASLFLAVRRELVRRDKAQERADALAARRRAREPLEMRPASRRRRIWLPAAAIDLVQWTSDLFRAGDVTMAIEPGPGLLTQSGLDPIRSSYVRLHGR